MAVDRQKALQYVESHSAPVPEGIQKGTPQYEQWAIDYLTNAVNAGVPDAVRAVGGGDVEVKGWEEEGGAVLDPQGKNAAPPSEWMGKRKPTPSELRRASAEGVYFGSEDGYDRFSDRQLAAWINNSWDAERGGFYTSTGQQVGKPPDQGPDGSWVAGEENFGKGKGVGGGGGGKGGKPAEPVKPTTYTKGDEQLSMTGNPLVDMMISSFNQAQGQRKIVEGGGEIDRSQLGAFARGENQQVGGGDDLHKLAGMLMGTGGNAFLWTAVDDSAFGGLKGQWKGDNAKPRANRPQVPAPSPATIANPTPPPAEQQAAQAVAPSQPTQPPTAPNIPQYKQDQLEDNFGRGGPMESSPFAAMMRKHYGDNAPMY